MSMREIALRIMLVNLEHFLNNERRWSARDFVEKLHGGLQQEAWEMAMAFIKAEEELSRGGES